MRVQKLATASEAGVERVLRRVIDGTEWMLTIKTPIQTVLAKDEHLTEAEFSMYTRGHFDFVVYRAADSIPEFAVEFDGFGHDQPRQIDRDLLKNGFCASAGFPLLRIGAEHLREKDEYSVLEWLIGALVIAGDEDESDGDSDEEGDEGLGDLSGPDDDVEDGPDDEPALGEPGIELVHPFPDNALVAQRLLDRFGIVVGGMRALDVLVADAPYLMDAKWPGRQPPPFRDSAISRFVVSEREFRVTDRRQLSDPPVFASVGRAEFAYAHWLPRRPGEEQHDAPVAFPWDSWGVAIELAMYDALGQVERWAAGNIQRPGAQA